MKRRRKTKKLKTKRLKNFYGNFLNPYRNELTGLFSEMEALQTCESKLYKSLDKIEAVIQHNEADISNIGYLWNTSFNYLMEKKNAVFQLLPGF